MRIPFTRIDIGVAGRSGSTTARSWNPTDERWYAPFPWLNKNGTQSATPDNATQVPPLFTGIKILSESVGAVPLILYKRKPNDERERATDHSLYSVLKDMANPRLTALEFKEIMTSHMILRGNGFAQIIRNYAGEVLGLYPLNPTKMSIEFDQELNEHVYVYILKDGSKRKFTSNEIFHLRGPSEDGVWGVSFVQSLRKIIEHNMTLDEYANNFYVNNAAPSGVLQMAAGIEMSQKAKDNLREEWKKKYQGAHSGSVAILEEGLTWQQIGMTSQDSQFIDTLKDARLQILGALRVAPYLAGDTEKLSFNSVEQLSIQFINYTMLPYFVRWQQTIYRDLLSISEKKKYYAEFLIDVLQKGDFISRYRGYAIGRQWGWLSVNDIRRLENLNPIDGGDVYLQPLNMVDAAIATDYMLDNKDSNESVPNVKNELDDNSNILLKNSIRSKVESTIEARLVSPMFQKLSEIEGRIALILEGKEPKTLEKAPESSKNIEKTLISLRENNIAIFADPLARAMRKERSAFENAERKNKVDSFEKDFYPDHKDFIKEVISPAVRSYIGQIKMIGELTKGDDLAVSLNESIDSTLNSVIEIFDLRYKKAGEDKANDFAKEVMREIEKNIYLKADHE